MIVRIMVQNRRSTLINFLGLILGLTSFIVIFSWIRTEYSVDRFQERRNQLFQLVIQFPEGLLDSNTPYALAPAMKRAFPEIESYTRVVRMESQVNSSFDFYPDDPDNDPVYEPRVARVDSGFFSMFTFDRISGNVAQGITRPDGVFLSKEIARKYFGDADPLGSEILMNGRELLEVTGVIDLPENSQLDYDLYLPAPASLRNNWNWRDPSYILLNPAADLAAFETKIRGFFNEACPNPLPEKFILKVVPIAKSNLVFGKKKEFMLFSGIALLILIIVAFNYMNLSTANYTRRIREMGIRKINGATPAVLRKQLITETLIQTGGSMIIALFLAELMLPSLDKLFNETVRIGYLQNPVILGCYLLLLIVFSFLAVAYPVLLFTRGNPTTVLRDAYIRGKAHSNILWITTLLQFTISVSLIISSIVVMKQVQFARTLPPGLDVENVIKVPLNPRIGMNLSGFFDKLESHPGILETTAGQANPVNEESKTNVDWPNRNPDTYPLVRFSIGLPDFPAFFKHEILLGRLFRDQDLSDRKGYLINQAACELMGIENPVGESMEMWGQEGEILGVFRNYHHISAHSEIMPQVLTINPEHYRHLRYLFIRLAPLNQEKSIAFISDTFKEFAGEFPFIYEYLEDEMDSLYAKDMRLAKMLAAFTVLALLISCLGIYGLARYSVERKVRDLTIRRVFGASLGKIIQIAQIDMLRRIGFSVVMAIPVSYFLMEHWLRSFAYRIGLSWVFFVLGAIIGIGITVMSTMIGIRRSLSLRPVDILKKD